MLLKVTICLGGPLGKQIPCFTQLLKQILKLKLLFLTSGFNLISKDGGAPLMRQI